MYEGVSATPSNMRRYAQPNIKVGYATVSARQPFAYSPVTDERYSASPGDYWDMPDNEPLRDSEGNPMILVFEVSKLIDADKYER